ncbi:MAG: hypothetical protein U0736_23445 [Gemmataceae bacterium]
MADKSSHKPTNHKNNKRPEQAPRSNPAEIGSNVERAARQVGERVTSVARELTDGSKEGALGASAAAMSHFLDQAGKYIQEHGLAQMTKETARIVSRYPVASVCVGVVVGFLLGGALSSDR